MRIIKKFKLAISHEIFIFRTMKFIKAKEFFGLLNCLFSGDSEAVGGECLKRDFLFLFVVKLSHVYAHRNLG